MNQTSSLRTRLRDDTRLAHERVDAAYRSCDIATEVGLRRFLLDHLRAFASLSIAEGLGRSRAEALRAEYCAAIEADLTALGCFAGGLRQRVQATPIPALYIFLGSRRGAQVMRRYWAAGAEGAARRAGAFLSLDPCNGEWRRLCQDLSARPVHGIEADRIVAEANAIFDLFNPRP